MTSTRSVDESGAVLVGRVGDTLPPHTLSWGPTDTILYALGVGARPPTELPLLNEALGPAVLPTYALVANFFAVASLRDTLGLGSTPIVHSAQSLELTRPLDPTGEVTVAAEVSAVYDTGKHAVIELTSRGEDGDGLLFTARSETMALKAGGFGGDPRPAAAPTPDLPPTAVVDDAVRAEQAALYRLSGDRNQLHIDPAVAARYGFDDVFLHGLCTLGFAARAVISAAADGDPSALRSISCRFASPVMLDAPLRTEVWTGGDEVAFRTTQGDATALSAGTAIVGW
ncbi:MaoC/PaaZ C-terminal domain-containing protein [uncultured Williamsia sp.]|uniref:MaoC/PaaZ C-terminal domain-containing protein n=1 Tax=uncultured Williamsia sp. TaxID=259311 RepID=UPI0026125917|nr:MaoC/PaaZ C-terminal domain-containing protein [uncultured Williamsia sp.]